MDLLLQASNEVICSMGSLLIHIGIYAGGMNLNVFS